MKKMLLSLAIVTAFLLVPLANASAANVQVVVNGQNINDRFEVQPIVDNSSVLVPLRAIFEAVGATVEWEQDSQTARAVKGNTTVIMVLGSLEPTVNGTIWPLEVPAQAVNESILAPLRFAGEAFGGTATWDGPNYTAIINTSGTPVTAGFKAANVVAAFSPVDCDVNLAINASTSKQGDVPLDVTGSGYILSGGPAETNVDISSTSFIFSLLMGEQDKTIAGCPFSELIYGPASLAEQSVAGLKVSENGGNYLLTSNGDEFPPSVYELMNNAIDGVTFQSLTGDYIVYVDKSSMQVERISISSIDGEGTSTAYGNVHLTGDGELGYSY